MVKSRKSARALPHSGVDFLEGSFCRLLLDILLGVLVYHDHQQAFPTIVDVMVEVFAGHGDLGCDGLAGVTELPFNFINVLRGYSVYGSNGTVRSIVTGRLCNV